MNFDLHCHSSCSHDCDVPPQDQLTPAEQIGLDYFSITDHNSVKAHLILKDPALRARFSGKMIAGAELSASFRKENVELLAYGFDPATLQKKIEENYLPIKKKFQLYKQAMIQSCRAAGAKMDEAKVEEFFALPTPSRKFLMAMLKEFPENRRLFLHQESWEDYGSFLRKETNNPESPLFSNLDAFQAKLETAVRIIRESGGMLFLAHPLIYSPNVTDHLNELIDLVQPDGLECFYPQFTAEQTEFLLSICKKRNLFASGGSDNHGPYRPNPIGEYGQFQSRAAKEISRWINNIKTY